MGCRVVSALAYHETVLRNTLYQRVMVHVLATDHLLTTLPLHLHLLELELLLHFHILLLLRGKVVS